MRLSDERRELTLKLYLRLCAILAPLFLLASAIGLFFLTEHIVSSAEERLSIRVGNAAARVANGLERVSEVDAGFATNPTALSEELIKVLMADPAVVCIEIVDRPGHRAIAQVPRGVNCKTEEHDTQLTLPLYVPDEADLIVRIALDEVQLVRDTQQRLSAVILFAGLMIALITNWITFRLIIGKPLSELVGQIDDARKQAEANALSDSLTGLSNRRHLNEVIEQLVDGLRKNGVPFAALQLDLDHFKDINDTLGHAAGDAVLQHVADILRSAVRPEDTVARTGGDEFVIVIHGEAQRDVLAGLAERLILQVSRPLVYQAHSCSVATSIGICPVTEDNLSETFSGDEALINGGFALHQAKAAGRGRYLFFEEGMRAEVEANRFLAADFDRGVRDSEIECFYQPQYDVEAQRVLSVEALARWRHPLLGVLNPHEFLPLADKLAMTPRVDQKILRMAVKDLARWDAAGLGIQSVSVNISATRLEDPGLLEELRRMQLPPNRLTFEILETAFVDELSDQMRWNLDGIRELGIEIELDDFGTGKASVLGVIEVAPTRIKVARELVASLGDGEQGISFVRAVAAIGHSLNVGMVAEGVEEAVHCRIAAELGFHRLQGFHIAKPMPRCEFEAWLGSENFELTA